MRKVVLCITVIGFLASSCLKKTSGCGYSEQNIVAPTGEQATIEGYLSGHGITATKHSSGMYYEILSNGSNGSPNICSQIQVNYVGTLSNGTVFDQNTNFVYDLGALIEGWKKGLPLIQRGGHIKLYIPPSLGYGATDIKDGSGVVKIPGNSMLVFDITLTDFN